MPTPNPTLEKARQGSSEGTSGTGDKCADGGVSPLLPGLRRLDDAGLKAPSDLTVLELAACGTARTSPCRLEGSLQKRANKMQRGSEQLLQFHSRE